VKVSDLCVRTVLAAAPEQPVEDLARRMEEAAVGTVVVVDGLQRPLGIVTDRDLMARCIAVRRDARRTPVEQVMSGPVAWIHEGASVEEALEEMARLRVRRLAVVDDRERLAGMIALDDVLCREFDSSTLLGRTIRATM
jgi:CBS domain-containing protein